MTLSEVSSTKYTLMGQSAFSGGHGTYHWPAWAEGLRRQPSPGLVPVGDSGLRPRSGPAAPLSCPHRAPAPRLIPGQLFLSELPGAMTSCCWAWTAPRSPQSRRAGQGLRNILAAPTRPDVLQQGEAAPVVSAQCPSGTPEPPTQMVGQPARGLRETPSSLITQGMQRGQALGGFQTLVARLLPVGAGCAKQTGAFSETEMPVVGVGDSSALCGGSAGGDWEVSGERRMAQAGAGWALALDASHPHDPMLTDGGRLWGWSVGVGMQTGLGDW